MLMKIYGVIRICEHLYLYWDKQRTGACDIMSLWGMFVRQRTGACDMSLCGMPVRQWTGACDIMSLCGMFVRQWHCRKMKIFLMKIY